jgi:hypothetical protein
MTKDRLEELLAHVRALKSADKQAGRLHALDVLQDIESILEKLKEKCGPQQSTVL